MQDWKRQWHLPWLRWVPMWSSRVDLYHNVSEDCGGRDKGSWRAGWGLGSGAASQAASQLMRGRVLAPPCPPQAKTSTVARGPGREGKEGLGSSRWGLSAA